MDQNVAIHVNNISKHFKVYFDKGLTIKERLLFSHRRRYEERRVLNGISFEIQKGQAVGLIGHNGCGKSTTLKMLSKIMYPESGSIETQGRISALIELGAGFHPDMSGRENIYINAAIFGLSRSEIDARLQNIIDFSELGSYIDNPVRTYSSGMYMRLAFSVAINVDADILLIDEILAVGDAAFQAKCFNKLREIKAKGTTIVIVSHSLGQIEMFCDRSIWIHDGQIKMDGVPRDVHPEYMDFMGRQLAKGSKEQEKPVPEDAAEEAETSQGTSDDENVSLQEESAPKTRWGDGKARFTNIQLLDADGNEKDAFITGESMKIVMKYAADECIHAPIFGIGIFRNDGIQCYGTNTYIDRAADVEMGLAGEVYFSIEKNLLLQGEYSLDVAIHTENGFICDYYRFAKGFKVFSDIQDVGISRLEHSWEFIDEMK